MQKNELRSYILTKLNLLPKDVRKRHSDVLIEKLKNTPAFQQAKTVLLYVSKNLEVDTYSLLSEYSTLKKIYLPKITGDLLTLHPLHHIEELQPGAFGVLEPSNTSTIAYDDIDCAIIPGIAFTLDGKRLGRGKGYYDRLLAQPSKATTIALAWNEQIVEDIPMDPHDQKVHIVITTYSS